MRKRKVLVVDDEKLIRWSVGQRLLAWGFEATEAENAATAIGFLSHESPDLVLLDMRLPDGSGMDVLKEVKSTNPALPVIMITAHGVLEEAVEAMRAGAYHFLTKPINFEELKVTMQNALEMESLKQEIDLYKEREKRQFDPSTIVAESAAMRRVLEVTAKIARSEASLVLLTGESGSGKDLVAHAIHDMSRRCQRPFLAINCSAIPETLLESELFGHEKGAFTDARAQKRGLLEIADGGTVFLDEVGDLSLGLQAKFLRFLEERTFKRVGGLTDIEVDVRIVAATNVNLEAASRDGKFRRDLYFRLSIMPIQMPSLRERPEDIEPLARRFVQVFNEKFKKSVKGVSPRALERFLSYDWPGNVRELRNAVERAMILEDGDVLDISAFPMEATAASPSYACVAGMETPGAPGSGLDEVEKCVIEKALAAAHGNQSRAARILKVSRDRLRYKMKKYGLGGGRDGD